MSTATDTLSPTNDSVLAACDEPTDLYIDSDYPVSMDGTIYPYGCYRIDSMSTRPPISAPATQPLEDGPRRGRKRRL